MRRSKDYSWYKFLVIGVLIGIWAAAYYGIPRMSPLDGPFDAQPFGFEASNLPFMSKTELKLLGMPMFILESRENQGPAPGTVFVLRGPSGRIMWTRLGAPELGRIRLEERSAHWFLPGGWIIRMKPEYTGAGEM